MSKKAIVILSLFFLLLISPPVLADVNLDINGKVFEPSSPPQLEEGITTVPLSVIAKTLGADVFVNEQKTIDINESGTTLQMTVGSLNATYNGESILMPKAPEIVNDEIMVPIRFVLETFGVEIGWQGEDKTVTVEYQEKRNGMTVDEMLTEVSANMKEFNTYKMKVDLDMIMDTRGPGEGNQKIDMSSSINAAIQNDPVIMYMEQQVSACNLEPDEENDSNLEEITTETLINEDGFYMTLPEQGWVKMDFPGMDMKALMEQSGNQDPVSSIQEMKDYGIVMSYANDQEKDGQEYWIINVTMGKDSFSRYYQALMEKIPFPNPDTKNQSAQPPIDIQAVVNDFMKNMQVNMVYNVWVDKESLLPRFMDLDADIKINMEIPGEDNEKSMLEMTMLEDVFYEIYDLGLPVTVPDVSEARDFNEVMQEQMEIPAEK